MIFEFAVEPEVVATWHNRKVYRFFDGKFGIGTKRTLCRYPAKKKWERLVFEAFRELSHDLDKAARQSAKKRLVELLQHFATGSTQRNQNWKDGEPWLECALREHRRRSFHGLLVATAGAHPSPPVYQASQVEESDTSWNPVPDAVPRSLAGLVDAVAPILRHVRRVALVDPYFDPAKPRWRKPLERMLQLVQARRSADESVVLEVHTCVNRFFGPDRPQTLADAKAEAQLLADGIRQAAVSELGPHATLLVRVWADRVGYSGDEEIHNRYLLTECGGVMFGKGFDTGTRGKDTPTLLSRPQWASQDRLYSAQAKVFFPLAEVKETGR